MPMPGMYGTEAWQREEARMDHKTSRLYTEATGQQQADARELVSTGQVFVEYADRFSFGAWVQSSTADSGPYYVVCVGDTWRCSCPAHKTLGQHKHCKHTVAASLLWASDRMLKES